MQLRMTETILPVSHVLSRRAQDEIYLLHTSHYFLNFEILCSTKLKLQIISVPLSYLSTSTSDDPDG